MDKIRVISIDPRLFEFPGRYTGTGYLLYWEFTNFLRATIRQPEVFQALVDALIKAIGYTPFCRYKRDGLETVEWTNYIPAAKLAFAELKQDPWVSELIDLRE